MATQPEWYYAQIVGSILEPVQCLDQTTQRKAKAPDKTQHTQRYVRILRGF